MKHADFASLEYKTSVKSVVTVPHIFKKGRSIWTLQTLPENKS